MTRKSALTCLAGILAVSACGAATQATPALDSAHATPIDAIQGPGVASPMVGAEVTAIGVVTGDFQNNDADTLSNLGGFYLQQENPDDDPRTSEGIFVFDGEKPQLDVHVGDRIEVRGKVVEYFSETQIHAISVKAIGNGHIDPVDLVLPAKAVTSNADGSPIADLERFEGMLVRFPQALTISDLYTLERFGDMQLVSGGRAYQFTNAHKPDPDAYRDYVTTMAARSLWLDDGLRDMYPKTNRFVLPNNIKQHHLRVGDGIANVTGNLRYSRGSGGQGMETWRLMPTALPRFDVRNRAPGLPPTPTSLRVASMNLLNFFTTIDNGEKRCGPGKNLGCRGANSNAEFQRQLEKIVTVIDASNAAIVGLNEIENNDSASLQELVDALNKRANAPKYQYVNTGTIGQDAIKVGVIYQPSVVQPQGHFAILDSSVDKRFDDHHNRPSLAQTFVDRHNGTALTVAISHLKSKGSDCNDVGDPNQHDGQGNCNKTRMNAATALAHWMTTDPTGSGDKNYLLIGDFNSYRLEDPLMALSHVGLVNLLETSAGGSMYSFVYDGQSGALDHAFATPGFAARVAAVREWHINADEAQAYDYNLDHDRNPDWFNASKPYRASDHDPLLIDLN